LKTCPDYTGSRAACRTIVSRFFIEKYFPDLSRSERRIYPAIIDRRKWLCRFRQSLRNLILAAIPLK
jgi:hypothetical protein